MIGTPRKRRVIFALTAMALAVVMPLASLFAADAYLHHRYERAAGYNVWGYRGPVARRKQPGEYRVVVLGGSAAFGYGVNWDQAIPAVLERRLNRAAPSRSFTVVNLGYNNEGAYSFRFTLQDYQYLGYDLVCLYEGYNDLMGESGNLRVFRHDSPIFRMTGYLPIFPIVFMEKAAALRSGGDVASYYRPGEKTVFRPTLTARTTAEALQAATAVGEALERQVARVAAEPPRRIDDSAATGCRYPWQQYCQSVLVATDFALTHGTKVLVVTQPYELGDYMGSRHREQQRELAAMLQRRFGSDPRVRYVNLGPVVDLADPALSFDRMHLTVAGNARAAEALVEPVLALASSPEPISRHATEPSARR